MLATARDVPGGVDEVNAASAMHIGNAGHRSRMPASAPNELVDAATGAIDYTRSSWGRSSWGSAPEALVAGLGALELGLRVRRAGRHRRRDDAVELGRLLVGESLGILKRRLRASWGRVERS